jgi:asparagine synthetase B (glutamine-hydrolysing)
MMIQSTQERGERIERKRKLEEARAKLHNAKRALEVALRKSANARPPIQALLKGGLDSLVITNIKSSGPAEKVYFATTTLPTQPDM